MNEKITIPLVLELEDLVYVSTEAERRGISLDALITEFVDQGMRQLALVAAWEEFCEKIIFDLAAQAEEMETALDVHAARRRSHRRRGRT
ncbi:MAG: hypothetical protein Q8J72_10220 [Rhodocyclaceae bacterium]|nr:hypothetical protein [Rhodocyclaceae bacterium]